MPGTIVFRPLEANIVTRDQDLIGKMDPYLSFHSGALTRVKSQTCKSGGQHPVWNDAVTVEVHNHTTMTVDVKDKDMLLDDKIGSFTVDIREIEAQGQTRKWYPIFHGDQPAGELLMEAVYSGQGLTHLGQNQGYSGQNVQSNLPQQQYGGVIGGTTLSQGQSYPIQSNIPQQQYGMQGQQGQFGGYPQQGSLQQGGLQQGGFPLQQGGLQQGGFPLQQGGLQQGGFPQQQGGFQQGGFPQQQYGSNIQPVTSEQFAKEALLRGSDPLNTQQNYLYNTSGQGYGGQNMGGFPQGQGQNLTQTPQFSNTDPLLYEGDKNRFSNPAQQVPYGSKGGNLQQGGNFQQGGQQPGYNNNNNQGQRFY